MRLRIRPLPYSGESTVGYLQRLAIRNGFTDARQLAALAANDAAYNQESSWYNLIQAWTGHDHEQLALLPLRRSARGHAGDYVLNGVPLRRKHVVKGINICPHCWREHTYHRADWQLVWKPICETHRCPLEIHNPDGDGALLARRLQGIALLPRSPISPFSDGDIRQVIELQQQLTRDILLWESDAHFSYYQACNYVDRLVDRLHPRLGAPRAGAPIQRSQQTPLRVIECMLKGDV